MAGVKGGLPVETPALTLNRLCGSGLQAIITAAQAIMLGDADVAVAGGAENMSRSPYLAPAMRWGARMNDATHDRRDGRRAERPVRRLPHGRHRRERRQEVQHLARGPGQARRREPPARGASRIDKGYFKEQIVPVEIKVKGGTVPFEIDETVRRDSTVEKLAKLKPVFDQDGTVTAGNASSINDAAAAVVLMERGLAEKRGLEAAGPAGGLQLRRRRSEVHGHRPGAGGAGAAQEDRAGARRTSTCSRSTRRSPPRRWPCAASLELPPDRTNPNGSGISLGHPIGATGCILTIKALYELQRTGGKRALVTMCIGGGQGIAAIFERM